MAKRTRMKKENADLDIELDNYEPSSGSDNEYDDNEKLMLQQAAKRRSRKDNDDDDDESEEEVFGIHDSEDDEDELPEPLGEEMDSDIEGKDEDEDRLPDSKAWGTRKGVYYKTDYVDEDYGGFSKAEEEEAALKEEEEARSIQTRLVAELDEADIFPSLEISKKSSGKKQKDAGIADDEYGEVIKADLSKLTKREKLALLEKESPEFKGLVSDFKERMAYAKDHLEPILKLVEAREIPKCPAVTFIDTKFHTTLNYCINIIFYLLLKSKRVRVSTHPVIKRLVQYRKLLEEMDPLDHEVIQPQVKEILELKERGEILKVLDLSSPQIPVIKGNRAERRKMLQQLREEQDESKAKKWKGESFEDIQSQELLDESGSEDVEDDTEKRGITFEIAKNKGLTPRRKKENRNPRVKHRNKFRKATIRRKGQVRTPYKEKKPDGTVPFGIKVGVVKSVKLK